MATASDRLESERIRNMAFAVRAAGADKSDWEKFLKMLER